MNHAMENILVTRLRFMGDVILTTPSLYVLRRAFPQAHIAYLTETPYDALLQAHPWVDAVFGLDRQRGGLSLPWLRELRRRKWDLAIDLFGNPRSALLTWLSGSRMRIGGDFRGRRLFYTHRIRDDRQVKTAIRFHLNYLQPLQLPITETAPLITVTEFEISQAKTFLAAKDYDLSRPIVGIHPGATWPAKRWFPERFAQLAAKLHQAGIEVFFTCGPGDEELVAGVVRRSGLHSTPVEVLSLRQLAAVIRLFSAFVCNDCGPMHLAPAVGTPTVGIFGPGEPQIWFPYDQALGHRLVYHEVDCSHCHQDFCETMHCMQAITVEEVYDKVLSSLQRR